MSRVPSHPRLVAVTGLMSGEVFSLAGSEVTFGRDAANAICFPDPALSRRHCVFVRDGEHWTIRDLDSSNGTFVNGLQVSTHRLTEGDRLALGGSVLLFVKATAAAPSPVEVVEGEVSATTVRLPITETTYLDGAAAPRAAASRVEEGLRSLLALSTVIHAARTETELRRELLQIIQHMVPAEGAAIVLGHPDGELEVVDAGGQAPGPVLVSRSIVRRVMAERTGALSRDVTLSRTFAADRMTVGDARSLLCVPVVVRDTALGAIYLITSERATFDEEHLQLVTAAARLAAVALDNVRHLAAIERDAERLHADLQLGHRMVGSSPAMGRVYDRLARVARTDTTVLITGESGTGKELAARAVHLNSPRARRPFAAINCAVLSETLLESELFGHERGAFTGALAQKKGRFELADGGTVFLDEIGELATPLQARLLRVLQEREFERVGGTRPIKVDIRLIAATNRNLAADVQAGRFRHDLFFRLNVVAIEMPPLRERRDDVPLLAHHFLKRYAPKAARRMAGISAAALDCLCAYAWPGNVRELENAIERAVVLGSTEEILPEDLPEALLETTAAPSAQANGFHAAVVETKKKAIIQAFRATGGSYTEAARALGVHPNYLHRLVNNLGLRSTLSGEL